MNEVKIQLNVLRTRVEDIIGMETNDANIITING